jgi:DNA mismatch repair protein MutS2
MQSMRFPEKTIRDLEWPRLLEYLAERCTGEQAAEKCRNLSFLTPEDVPKRLSLIAEFMACIAGGDPPPRLPVRPVDDWLARIQGDGTAPAGALQDIAANLKLYVAIERYVQNRRDTCPGNAAFTTPADSEISSIALARLSAEIESSFEPDGAIADGASPDLGRLRRRVVSLRKHIVSRIEQIAEREEDLLQERTVTIRNDRFVLPVRADSHRRLNGIVHGASSSGATVYVEPESMIETGNELMLAREEVAREEARILKELCRAVQDQLKEVQSAHAITIELETRIAAAKLANDLDAQVPCPASPGEMNLIDARHALLALDGVEVVANNITGSHDSSTVISGPNAGGKTVALKTVGLLGLMLAAGLPIPASPDSRIGVPHKILTDIGDDQSLIKNLSTFSAHMSNISSILASAEKGSIVLLDELCAGTDPSEGAALAEALLERLNEKGATTFATTHFDSLKGRAQAGDGFVNAAVGFDIEEMRPTFELKIGIPGSSSALKVARRFGIPGSAIERAEKILPGGVHELKSASEALDLERRKMQFERQALAEARRKAEEAKKNYDEEVRRLRSAESKLIDREISDLKSAIRRAREKVRDAEISIRTRRADATTVNRARKVINDLAEELDPGGSLSREDAAKLPGRPALEGEIDIGAEVYVKSLQSKGAVESSPKSGRVFVRIGNVKTRVRIDDLLLVEDREKSNSRARRPKLPPPSGEIDRTQAVKTGENTIDLRGATMDEAIEKTDAFLDRALKEDWPYIFVLHGHGTGALRNAVRGYLSESRYVETFRPGEREEGGDGVTLVWLRWK